MHNYSLMPDIKSPKSWTKRSVLELRRSSPESARVSPLNVTNFWHGFVAESALSGTRPVQSSSSENYVESSISGSVALNYWMYIKKREGGLNVKEMGVKWNKKSTEARISIIYIFF